MRGDPRGVLLFGLELNMLRRVRDAGGSASPDEPGDTWDTAAELCRLGLLARDGDVLIMTPAGDKVLRLTADVPEGRVGFISTRQWAEA